MYVSTQPIDLIKYHLKQKDINYQAINTDDAEEVNNCLYQGNPLKPPYWLIQYTGKKRLDLNNKNKFNVVYLVTHKKAIDPSLIKKDWVQMLTVDTSLYLQQFNQYQNLFTPAAADHFLELFGNKPEQLNVELMRLIIHVAQSKELITVDHLRAHYENVLAPTLYQSVGLIGTERMLKLTLVVSQNELWTFYINRGTQPSILEQHLAKRNDSAIALQGLLYLKQAVYDNVMKLEHACYLYNLWLLKEQKIERLKRWLNL